MNTLKKYDINDFLKLNTDIKYYCSNLTKTQYNDTRIRDYNKSNELYQEVCVRTLMYLNKKNLFKNDEHFKQFVKRMVYFTYINTKYKFKNAKLHLNKVYIEDNSYLLDRYSYSVDEYINTSIDKDIKLKKFNNIEVKVLEQLYQGYNKTEVSKNTNLSLFKIDKVLTKLTSKPVKKQIVTINNCFKQNTTSYKIIDMHNQGIDRNKIAKELNISNNTINQIIFRAKHES